MPVIRVRLRDTTRHICMPIKTSCGLFCILSAIIGAYVMFFLPAIPRYILMALHLVVGLFGLATIITGKTAFTDWYRIALMVTYIPVLVVLGFITYLMSIYGAGRCNHNSNSYISWMCGLNLALLASGECMSMLFMFFCALTLMGYWKLRWFQTGVFRLRYPEDPAPAPPVFRTPQPATRFVLDASIQPMPLPSPTLSEREPEDGNNFVPFSHWTEEKE